MTTTCFCPVCGAANELESTHCFACGQFLVRGINETEVPQEVLLCGRYQLGTLLGSGGFSMVYHARDMQADGREVAIKQIRLQGLSAEETIEATDKKIASGDGNGVVQIWGALSATAILTYPGDSRAIIEVNWSPNGALLASASEDMTVRIWLTASVPG